MNREDGFPIADIDVGLFHDQKVIALARRVRDERRTAATVALYTSLLLESWSAGDRVRLDEAIPAWWMAELDDVREDLRAVGLIDDDSRIPVDAWTNWFVPAWNRRQKRRASGAEGGRRSWQSRRDQQRRSDAEATSNPSVLPSGRPTRPSRPEDAATCALCGRAVSADNERLGKIDGKFATTHRECPVEAVA